MLIKQAFVGGITTMSLGAITWMTVTLINMDKEIAVMSVKIEQNNAMLKPLWEDFIKALSMNRPQSRSKVNLGRGACPVVKIAKNGVVKMKKGGKICPEGKAWAKRTFGISKRLCKFSRK